MSPSAVAPARPAEIASLGLGLGAIAAFALTLPLSRLAVRELDPTLVAFGRGGLAGIAALVYLRMDRAPLPSARQLRDVVIAASGVVLGFPLLITWAMAHSSASRGGVVLALVPLATALVASAIAGERPSRRFWVGAAGGSAMVIAFAIRNGTSRIGLVDVALVGSVVMAAVGYAYSGRLSRELGGARVISWALVVCLPVTLPATAFALASARLDASFAAWSSLVYLALVSQFLAFFLWNHALAIGGIARVSQLQLLQPFLTVCAAAFVLGETIELGTLGYAFAVVACVGIGRSS